jgi:cobalt/nickel transport system permease protein
MREEEEEAKKMSFGDWIEVGRMDELGRQDTPAHRIDARAKAVTTILFIVFVMSFSRYEVSALTPFFLYPLVLMSLGRIPAEFLFRKILVAAPVAVVIGMFNPFFDREPVAWIGSLAISGGWISFTSILLRFVLTVAAALVLVACTGMNRLCAGLERMGLPRVFAVQLLFLYRYLFVVGAEGARMLRSMELRSAGSANLGLRIYGSLVGHLLIRSMARADRIYRSMVARGFEGDIRILHETSLGWADAVFMCGWTAFFVAARMWNLADLLGRLFTGGAS